MTKPKRGKFLQTLGQTTLLHLETIAAERQISLQELIRAVIVPEWLELHKTMNRPQPKQNGNLLTPLSRAKV
jgi:hypothetical protein